MQTEADSRPVLALEERIGQDFTLGAGSSIAGIGGPAQSVQIGDQVRIGDGVEIRARNIRIGDYVTIHRNTTIYGYDDISIGECSWIGQNVILNCTAALSIGRGCILSAYCNVWTHFSGGDVLQGCRYDQARPCQLGDDVWIGVQASIAPVRIGERALVLAGSILSKDVAANEVWGGNPAANLTEKLGRPYQELSQEVKFELLCAKLREFWSGPALAAGLARATDLPEVAALDWLSIGGITVTKGAAPADGSSIFDVRSRSYSKQGTPQEIAFMRYLLYRIKFFAAA